jgi:uncharacterized protein YacL
MPLIVLRILFVAVSVGIASLLMSLLLSSGGFAAWLPWAIFLGCIALASSVIAADIWLPQKRIDVITAIYFGLAVGAFLTYIAMLALTPLLQNAENASNEDTIFLIRTSIQLILGMVLCYTCISVLLQTKDDFRFIIPYVEFAKEVKGLKPYILDTSVVIDGRIADLVDTNVLDNQLIMPRFVLAELQGIADSSDKLRRARGRRGLDILNRLRTNENVDLKIYDREIPEMNGQPVDMKLVLLARHLEGKIVTGDYNLNKVARLHNVPVINLNDIANSLKPVCLPGEALSVRIVKAGEEPGQGVGYLDDGTMIVVEGGREQIGKEVKISVTSVLQTSAGRMIFGKYAAA